MTETLTDGSPSAAARIPFHLDMSTVRAVPRIAEARADLADETDPVRRSILLAVSAVAYATLAQSQPTIPAAPTPDGMTNRAAAQEALAEAEQLAATTGDSAARVYTLLARAVMDLSPAAADTRRELTAAALAELANVTCAEMRQALLGPAFFLYGGALLEAGDTHTLDSLLSVELHPDDLVTPVLGGQFAVWLRCARASMDGQLTLAEQWADEGFQLAMGKGDVDAYSVWIGQVTLIRWLQGRIAEMEPIFLAARREDPSDPVWTAVLAWIWTHQGRVQAARGLIDSLPDIGAFPRGRNWLAGLAILAEVAAAVDAGELMDELIATLTPHAHRLVSIGLGIASWGTAARPLALMHRRRGEVDRAAELYRIAIDVTARTGAQAWLAQAQGELADLLYESGDFKAAMMLATESVISARHLRLRTVEQHADELLGGSPAAWTAQPVTPQPITPEHLTEMPGDGSVVLGDGRTVVRPVPGSGTRPVVRPTITVLGRFTVTDAAGRQASWRSRKARTLLKILLARRGAAIARESIIDQIWPGEDPRAVGNRFSVAMTTVRRVLDPQRAFPPDEFLVAHDDVVRLHIENLTVDVEGFLAAARRALAPPAGSDARTRVALLEDAIAHYAGEAFVEEPYSPWAEQLRGHTTLEYFALCHALADAAGAAGDELRRVELYRKILAAEPYDQRAHDGLIEALDRIGATSHLTRARADRARRMAELGLADSAV